MARIALIVTHGTIDSIGRYRSDLSAYADSGIRLLPEALLARVPEILEFADVRPVVEISISEDTLIPDWFDTLRTVHRVLGEGRVDGVVLTHGTNFLEETAYFLTLCLKVRRPVVIVGAMRPASAISGDGDLNLLNAARVAVAEESAGRGVVVVLNDTIYAARDVTKSSTYRVNSFESRELGPLGFADADGKIVYYHRTDRPHTTATEFDVRKLRALPRVDVLVSYAGSDGALIEAAVASGSQGIVIAGAGAGVPSPIEERALQKARESGLAVCVTSRVGSGRVVVTPHLEALGFLAAGNLPPWKARVLLAVALTKTSDQSELQRIFDTY